MIETSVLRKIYPVGGIEVRAVDGVDLTVRNGEFVTIVGRSGSGKTTLLSMLGGLTRPTDGIVKIDGSDIWRLRDSELSAMRGEKVGFVFQFSGLLPTLTCLENVTLPSLFVHGDGDVTQNAQELLNAVGLSGRANSYPSQLSGGEMKRAAVARSLLNDPSLILADEPTSDLDEDTEKELMDLFLKVNEQKKTVIVVTHNPALSSYGSRLLRMDRGKLTEVES